MIGWLDKTLALAIHSAQLSEHGGTAGVRDEGLLESALARPQQLYAYGDPTTDLAELAAALAYGIARNHPFVDGNKRTAFLTAVFFLELNSYRFAASEVEATVMTLALAVSEIDEDEFAAWLRANAHRR